MQTQFAFLSPVQVVKVTSQNLQEVAKWCGGKVAETESRRFPGRMDKYVWVPTPKGNSISWAFPGMFVTKRIVETAKGELKSTWAVFRKDYYDKNYFESPESAVEATWGRENEESKKKRRKDVKVETNIGDELEKAYAKVHELEKKLDEKPTTVNVVNLTQPKVSPLEMGRKIRKVEDTPLPEKNLHEEGCAAGEWKGRECTCTALPEKPFFEQKAEVDAIVAEANQEAQAIVERKPGEFDPNFKAGAAMGQVFEKLAENIRAEDPPEEPGEQYITG